MGEWEWRLGDSHFSEGWMGVSLPMGDVGKHHTRNISSQVGLEQETARVRRQEPAWLGRTGPASHEKFQKATFPRQRGAGTCLYPQAALRAGWLLLTRPWSTAPLILVAFPNSTAVTAVVR